VRCGAELLQQFGIPLERSRDIWTRRFQTEDHVRWPSAEIGISMLAIEKLSCERHLRLHKFHSCALQKIKPTTFPGNPTDWKPLKFTKTTA
jgi:hypothetical protein